MSMWLYMAVFGSYVKEGIQMGRASCCIVVRRPRIDSPRLASAKDYGGTAGSDPSQVHAELRNTSFTHRGIVAKLARSLRFHEETCQPVLRIPSKGDPRDFCCVQYL